MKAEKGDQALIYHSGDDKCVVGIAKVVKSAYPDPDPEKSGDWVQIDLAPVQQLKRSIPLKEIKATPALADMLLIKQSRLSCMPLTAKQFETLVKLGAQ
jgi:predicted RNA-binding protein with PUA-like domain